MWGWLKRALCDHDWREGDTQTYSSAFSMFAHPSSAVGEYRAYRRRDYCQECGAGRLIEWNNGALNR